jgi:hypothetical protein
MSNSHTSSAHPLVSLSLLNLGILSQADHVAGAEDLPHIVYYVPAARDSPFTGLKKVYRVQSLDVS